MTAIEAVGSCELLDAAGKGDLANLLQFALVGFLGELARQLAAELERQGGLVLLPVCAGPFEPCSGVVAVAQPVFEAAGEYLGDAILSNGAVVDLLRLANDGPCALRFPSPAERGRINAAPFAQPERRLGGVALARRTRSRCRLRCACRTWRSPMSQTPQSLMPLGEIDRSSSRSRPSASDDIRQAPVPGWYSASAAEDVRHPGVKLLKSDGVDLAPEQFAVVGLAQDRDWLHRELGRRLGLRLRQHQIVKPVRCCGELEEIQRSARYCPATFLLPSPTQTDGATMM